MDGHLSKQMEQDTTLAELLVSFPPPRREPDARRRIRERLRASGMRIAVIDDDPTGTQTVHDVPVWLRSSARDLREAMRGDGPLFFVSTNTRSMDARAAERLSVRIGRRLSRASALSGRAVGIISRSDSTLRGHYPNEVEALAHGLRAAPDALIIAPAFFEGGRFTAGDIHWVEQQGRLVPAAKTEFARDPVFGFRNSDLKLWIEEKTAGRVRADAVISVSLAQIRSGGPGAVAKVLEDAPRGAVIVVNACAYEDLEVFVLGMMDAEDAGRRFLCRTAASFVKVRAGLPDRPLLGPEEIGAGAGPVLIAVGSYVQKTTRQLDQVIAGGHARGIELHTDALFSAAARAREIGQASRQVSACLREGRNAALYTSRTPFVGGDFLRFGVNAMAALCEVVRKQTERPAAVVAKGGITSIEIARTALGARDAFVTGQIAPGVPVWRLGAGCRFPNVPLVVFPGNVGDDEALVHVLGRLTGI